MASSVPYASSPHRMMTSVRLQSNLGLLLQVVTTYLEGAKQSMEERRGLEEDVRWKAGAEEGVDKGMDLFEAQKALKMQPQVLDELAQLRSRLQETEQRAAEVCSHSMSLGSLHMSLMQAQC